MTNARDAASLIRTVGLMPDGPVRWGQPVRHSGPGVLVIELAAPVTHPHLDLARLGRYIEHVPELRVDATRPQGKELAARLAQFWLPSETVVFIGSSAGTVGGRMSSMLKTVPGDRKPAWTGYWLHFLRGIEDARVWWAATDAPEEYEDALLDAFASGVAPAERAALPDPAVVFPWATLKAPSGARRNAGITNPLVAEVKEPAPPPVTRIVDLPPAEADGATDEAKRKARPAPVPLFDLQSEGEFGDFGILRLRPHYEAGPGLQPMKAGVSKAFHAFALAEVTDLQGKAQAGALWLDPATEDGLVVFARLRLRPAAGDSAALELERTDLKRGKAAGKLVFGPAALR